ncbi:hypothetical protein SAMN05421781_0239 [Marinococcus luteus]|uniref:Uncharacterized protein n=1 Tax=Marinococcus luteus TaxID=1122204 RepID=A0A1H2QAY9_9BACI|nr:hypothetical protein SAMN05421781_0239 [Marinococcus luteus]
MKLSLPSTYAGNHTGQEVVAEIFAFIYRMDKNTAGKNEN